MRQRENQLTGTLADRGAGWQATGFTLTGIACLVILKSYEGSGYWPYEWFETATVDLYWSFLVPLAVLFDWGRKMFERGRAIREAKKAEIREKALRKGTQKGTQKGTEEENERIRKVLEEHGVVLSPEVAEAVFGNSPENAS